MEILHMFGIAYPKKRQEQILHTHIMRSDVMQCKVPYWVMWENKEVVENPSVLARPGGAR